MWRLFLLSVWALVGIVLLMSSSASSLELFIDLPHDYTDDIPMKVVSTPLMDG